MGIIVIEILVSVLLVFSYTMMILFQMTWQKLVHKFSQYGDVKHVFIPSKALEDKSKIYAFVTFFLPESATK